LNEKHGVHFQPSLSGTLHVARTNAFFMGGGKALVNAYFRSAEQLGIQIRYNAPVKSLDLDGTTFKAAILENGERIEAKTCILACGGFESNREWLRSAWGQNPNGEWPADNFLIRGTRFNRGDVLKFLLDAGADSIGGDPTQGHCVAIDARSPLYDGGICTRLDCVSLGVVVNQFAKRFYDEGEDFWPKRYAIWGRLVALQQGQIAYSIIDSKAIGRFMPPVFPAIKANSIEELAGLLKLDAADYVPLSTNITKHAELAILIIMYWTIAIRKVQIPKKPIGHYRLIKGRFMLILYDLALPLRISD
jgi:tricarballylate dehydrogenase